MAINPLHFAISATCQGEARTTTREFAASAMCLADNWAERGCQSIQITNSEGVSFTPEVFRANLPLRVLVDKRLKPT